MRKINFSGKIVFIVAAFWLALLPRQPAEAIINGKATADPQNSGVVFVCDAVECGASGTLLTNDWVVTTGHGLFDLAKPEHNGIWSGGYQIGADFHADFVVKHPSLDFSLMHLSKPVPINGKTIGYRMPVHDKDVKELKNLPLRAMGYGFFEFADKGHSGRLHESEAKYNGIKDEYNLTVDLPPGQSMALGDSGGPLFAETPEGRFYVGALKSGHNFSLPETSRDWINSYLNNKPIRLPDIWYLPYTKQCTDNKYCKLWDTPLQNNFENEYSWDPCPNHDYTWTARYSLEPQADFIYLTASGVTQTLTGNNQTANGKGAGPFTLKVKTNDTVRSNGLSSLNFTCAGLDFKNKIVAEAGDILVPQQNDELQKIGKKLALPWPQPLPEKFYSSTETEADPCHDLGPYRWRAEYSFYGNDWGDVFYSNDKGPQNQTFKGAGSATGWAQGALALRVFTYEHTTYASSTTSTPGLVTSTPQGQVTSTPKIIGSTPLSPGITSLVASCAESENAPPQLIYNGAQPAGNDVFVKSLAEKPPKRPNEPVHDLLIDPNSIKITRNKGNATAVSFGVQNGGASVAGKIEIKITAIIPSHLDVTITTPLARIDKGKLRAVTKILPVALAKVTKIIITIDPANKLREKNEENNTAQFELTRDLQIQGELAVDSSPNDPDQSMVTYTIINSGNAPTLPFLVQATSQFTSDETDLDRHLFPGLAPKGILKVHHILNSPLEDVVSVAVELDSDQSVTETDETNNSAEKQLETAADESGAVEQINEEDTEFFQPISQVRGEKIYADPNVKQCLRQVERKLKQGRSTSEIFYCQ